MEDIIITDHAKERFVERFSRMAKTTPKNPEASIRKLLKYAVPEEMNPMHRVVRLINNKGSEAEYLVHGGWRFVFVSTDAGKVLTTIERTKGRIKTKEVL